MSITYTELSKNMGDDVSTMIYKLVFNDVLKQLQRTIEPWYPIQQEKCGCVLDMQYPVYVTHYLCNEPFYHGPECCGNKYCQHCWLCDNCLANYYFNDRLD
jgi:hypothetical protein